MFVKGNHAYRIPCTKVPPNGDSHYINPCAMCYDGSADPLYNVSKHCASSDGDSLPQDSSESDSTQLGAGFGFLLLWGIV